MNSFDFFRFFGPQTVFIGGRGAKYIFLDFLEFFGPQTVK
jgi:hypothetical protein